MKLRRSLKNKSKNMTSQELCKALANMNYDIEGVCQAPEWSQEDYQWRTVVPSEKILEDLDKCINRLLIGTWFLLKENGHIYVSKEKPVRVNTVWMLKGIGPIGFLQLDEDGSRFFAPPYSALTREMFNKLQLPEVLEENVPLEIEIMPSGNVYFY